MLQGGYFPIKFDPRQNVVVNERQADAVTMANTSSAAMSLGKSMTKERVQGTVSIPLRRDFSVITESLTEQTHLIAMRLAVRDVRRIILNKEFAAIIQEHLGLDAYRVLRKWSSDCWAQEPTNQGGFERAMAAVRGNQTMAVLGFRTMTAVLNVLNIAPMAHYLSPARAMAALKAYYAHPVEQRALVFSKSAFMAERAETIDRDIAAAIRNKGTYTAKIPGYEFLQEWSFKFITETDLMLANPLWLSEYQRVYQEGMEKKLNPEQVEKDAINAGDKEKLQYLMTE